MSEQSRKLYAQYAKFIRNNSETCSDIEMLSKYVSYFVSGKISDNGILTEALISISNLFSLGNDEIIRREIAKENNVRTVNDEHKLKLFLTVLENVEVLIEITSKRLLGDKKKFIIIFLIQAVKCIGRIVLIIKYKNRISQSPAIEHLDRKNLLKHQSANPLQPELNNINQPTTSSITLKLKRSGKTIRKVASTPPLYTRSFKLPEPELQPEDRFGPFNHRMIKNAEMVYILKPMIHLGSIGLFGYKSWRSYCVSLLLDVYSIYQYYKHKDYMTSDQKKELSRRCVNMLLYILRSPFYDKYSASKIDAFFRALNKIPFAKLISEPYRLYVPSYQSTYFYMFSN